MRPAASRHDHYHDKGKRLQCHHSTESALLKVHSDIIISMDKGEVTALTLLDLSAAFDTIDHATLTDGLSDWYGISGHAQIFFFLFAK